MLCTCAYVSRFRDYKETGYNRIEQDRTERDKAKHPHLSGFTLFLFHITLIDPIISIVLVEVFFVRISQRY